MYGSLDTICNKCGLRCEYCGCPIYQRLTKEQAVILTAYTGILHGRFSDFHEDITKTLGRPIFTHELANQSLIEEIKLAYTQKFKDIQPLQN